MKYLVFLLIVCLSFFSNIIFADETGFNEKKVDINLDCGDEKNGIFIGIKKFEDKLLGLEKINKNKNSTYGLPVSIVIKEDHPQGHVYTSFQVFRLTSQKTFLLRSSVLIGDQIRLRETYWKANEKKISDYEKIKKQADREPNLKKFVKILEVYTFEVIKYFKEIKSEKPHIDRVISCHKY